MDNMLYIIAGLVLILLVAGLVLRKQKAQKPSVPPSGRKVATPTAMAKTDNNTPAQSSKGDDKKFDHITIAQRFIDQQRYDKAIETLNRGLNEKPHDSQLSLKLLSVYATTNEPENFQHVYDAIKTQNDATSIARADELKALFFEEQHQAVTQEVPIEDNPNFESIEFDLASSPVADENSGTLIDAPSATPTLSNDLHEDNATSENSADDFDLSLSDFENDFDEPNTTSVSPVTSLDSTDLDSTDLDNTNDASRDVSTTDDAITSEDTDISDFDFSFDASEESTTLTESPVHPNSPDSAAEELSLDNEEFILDFDDLASDVDKETEQPAAEALALDTTQADDNDFTLSLDSLDETNSPETVLENENPVFADDSSDSDGFILEDADVEESKLEDNDIENGKLAELSLDDDLQLDDDLEIALDEESSTTPTAPLLFDDHILIDDDFDLDSLSDSPTAATPDAPVEINTDITTEAEAETAEDFSSRFSADFDFVKSLDSHQVTLDLAAQYLQLGEYDSAKRLLNEVMVQGNSEQQNQAKALLERTA
ncbi:FimV/HubP family polar landmark protein [Psychrobacter namhaensis]|uniref:FimV/HubP family polar landmark protein n=1 Tax=Psychrobacter namhaensis TaxID=292734 RepID=UPI003FD5E839